MKHLSNSYAKIEYEDRYITYTSPRDYDNLSRYEDVNIAIEGMDASHTTVLNKIYEETKNDKYFRVTSREENRLDIIATDYYSNPERWWVIAYANNIQNAFNVPIGTILRIPYDLDSIGVL